MTRLSRYCRSMYSIYGILSSLSFMTLLNMTNDVSYVQHYKVDGKTFLFLLFASCVELAEIAFIRYVNS